MKELIKDNKVVLKFEKEIEIMEFIHKNHSYSVDHAFKYEGYQIKEGEK